VQERVVAGAMRGVRQWTGDTCLAACVATALAVRPDSVPVVDHALDRMTWLNAYNRKLRRSHGVWLLNLDASEWWPGYWIAVVPSRRPDAPGPHAILMRGRRVAWDPARGDWEGARYEKVDRDEILCALLFVVTEPERL
jgi:hypothetical protein